MSINVNIFTYAICQLIFYTISIFHIRTRNTKLNYEDVKNMDKKFDYKEIGSRIRIQRENLNLSREKFAEIVEISPYYLGQIERGDRRMSLEILMRIATSLHVSVDYILFGKIDENSRYLYELEYFSRESYNDDYNSTKNQELQDLIFCRIIDIIIGFSGKIF